MRVVDLFAGAGGCSTGLLQRLGAHVPIRLVDGVRVKAQIGPLTWP